MNFGHKFFSSLVIVSLLLLAAFFLPWDKINWGKIEYLPGSTITITGEAKNQLKNQIARFSVGVEVFNADKQTAIDEVNQKMTTIIAAVKDFGIEEPDIETQNVSVYETEDQPEILIYPPRTKGEAGWQASNTISITLRDVDQASKLADLLNSTEATRVNGPNFSLDDTNDSETDLLKAAIDDARDKAAVVAAASGRKLGKVLTVSESGSSYPMPFLRAVAEDSASSVPVPVEPGSSQVSKTVTVVFELK